VVLEAALEAVAAAEVGEQGVGAAAVSHVQMLELELEGFGSFLENTRWVRFGWAWFGGRPSVVALCCDRAGVGGS
jgi:hypothetical protein